MRAPVHGALLARWYRPRAVEMHDVPSESTPGVWWTVTLLNDGSYICDCPDYRIRRAPYGEECKHIIQVRTGTGWSKVRKQKS